MKKTKPKEINKKFVLVGDGYCGKSTLITAFYNRKFVEKYTPTIFDTFTVQTDIYEKQINLEICDSAGQEEFSRVRPLSYPEVDAIILCFSVDSRESSQNLLEIWLPEIRHFCSNKVPIVLAGCKIDLRMDRTTTSLNSHFMLKQEHLNHMNRLNTLNNADNQASSPVNSLHYGLNRTLVLYCCRHGRPCTCYHSRVCATSCTSSIKRKASNLSNSSNCLTNQTKASLNSKDNIIQCNRLLLQHTSPTRNSTNTDESFSSSEAEAEELQSNTLSNTMSDSSCSLNGADKTSAFRSTFSNTYNNTYNTLIHHNRSMLNTLIHRQIEHQQCGNSLNSSESEESETIDNHDDQQTNQISLIDANSLESHLTSIELPVDHLQSSIEEATKNQPMMLKNLKSNNRSRLFRGYKSFVNSTDQTPVRKLNKVNLNNKSSTVSLKDRKLFKGSSLKQKLGAILGANPTVNSSIYPSKSEKKLSNLFYNHKLSTSSASLPFSLMYKADQHKTEQQSNNSPFISTEEGLRLCAKIGAQAYVECSSKMNVGVDEVFRTALKLSIKHPIGMRLDMCSIS